MVDRIIKRKFFDVFQYDLEEKFLREMHQKGYALDKVSRFGKYEFIKVQPEDVVYKLDFPGDFRNKYDREDYLQLFKDSGWEYLGQRNEYTYFRKKYSADEDLDIFSDNESRKYNLKKIYKAKVFPLALIVFFLMIMDIGEDLTPDASVITKIAAILGIFSLFLGAIVLLKIHLSYFRIMKELREDEV